MFKLAWGAVKVTATLLLTLAIPVLVICLLFAGIASLIIPAAMIAGAFGLLKSSL